MGNDDTQRSDDQKSPDERKTSEKDETGASQLESTQSRASDPQTSLAVLLGASDSYKKIQQNIAASFAPALAAINAQNQDTFAALVASAVKLPNFNFSTSLGTLDAIVRYAGEVPALTRAQDYTVPDDAESAYSPALGSPEDYFKPSEEVITSFDDLHVAITKLIAKTSDLPLVWRGVKNSRWGLHSHLFRHLVKVNGVVPPSKHPETPQRYPDENQMLVAEREILRIARTDWRFDNMSALETFARIQHAGGPTRLIDVTKNPYVGAWFAVEADEKEENHDARLFAIATRPVAQDGKPPAPDSALQLDSLGAARDPFWHLLADSAARQQLDWGTGARRRFWVPPAYDPRISAQNAAFLVDGVPITSAQTAPYFTIEHNTYWRRADLLASASIYAKISKPTLKPKYNARNFAPTFSFRITANAKAEIREVLESRFGYRRSYIYPDMSGLAEHLTTLDLQ